MQGRFVLVPDSVLSIVVISSFGAVLGYIDRTVYCQGALAPSMEMAVQLGGLEKCRGGTIKK